MNADHITIQAYLAELIQCTQGNPDITVSMYDVGANLGLDKTQSGKLGEEVIGAGWAEIKTLSGAIGLTAEGIQAAGGSTKGSGEEQAILSWGSERVLTDESYAGVQKDLGRIQERIPKLNIDYQALEEIVMDIKTIDIQLLSPRPKTAIIRETLRSLKEGLEQAEAGDAAVQIEKMIGN